ncbi:MAG TPA: mandelate racemase/muconate lactonizing enzyme family protein [Pyrinomonadaceae bacterium]|nr:mandelate racemase/muconate lactonizing enzyme family protein [Pyrinomonadaceae bacterium]
MPVSRRTFLHAAALLSPAAVAALGAPSPKISGTKIARIRFYESPISRPMFNQSFHIVTVENDQGLIGVGEGGSVDTIRDCAELLIGEDPSRIDHCWQLMFRGRFYPAGREKLDAMGAIDLALWDLKGKALGVPVYEMLGGKSRAHVECYATGFPAPGDVKEKARACIAAGFRAFRTSVVDPNKNAPGFNSHHAVRDSFEHCQQIREGVGPRGDWMIDYHTRLDFPDAVRLSTLLEPLEPFFCEDLVRSENPGVYRTLRGMVKVPVAVGEQFGARWEYNELIENHLIDYSRVTVPNCGGITEFLKHAALCETHYVGLAPHFTGPVAEAALVHVCAAFSGPVIMEMVNGGQNPLPGYLPKAYDFRDGKMWPNDRPGLGVEFDATKLKLTAEFTKTGPGRNTFQRPDGSLTNW